VGVIILGAWINLTNRITISTKSMEIGSLSWLGYNDITEEVFQRIVSNENIKFIQIDDYLPLEAYEIIDRILQVRTDIYFRIYSLFKVQYFDLDVLKSMKHLSKLIIDTNVKNNQNKIELDKLGQLRNLKRLQLDIFDLKDYRFIQHLPRDMEELFIMADTMNGTPIFDSKWLLDFINLESLFLGKKAKKNFKCIGEIPKLKKLSLRGIKIDNFSFLKDSNIDTLNILWASVDDLSSLSLLSNLKHLQFWRIPKLDDISVLSNLEKLETLKLQDLKHISALPNLTKLQNFREITLVDVKLDPNSIPLYVTVKHW